MWRWHFFRNLRTAFFIAGAVAFLSGGGFIVWANHTGLPETWRATIEDELSKQGVYLTIDSLSYIPFKGVIAKGVRVFSDKERLDEVSQLERIVLDFDKAELTRQRIRLTKIELSDARLSMPIDPEDPLSPRLEVTGLNGTVLMPGGRVLEARDVRGKIAGIEVIFGARMLGYQQEKGDKKKDPNEKKRREIAAKFARELENWKFDEKKPPVLRIFAEGDLSDKSTLAARMSLQAKDVEKNGHTLEQIAVEASLTGNLLTLTSIRANDSRGDFEGRVDYDLQAGEGRFDINSGLEIPGLLKAWIGLPPIPQIIFGGSQKIEAEGDFRRGEDGKPPLVRVTGSAHCESVMIRGVSFDSVESGFSWADGNLYLVGIELTRKDGTAAGKALIQGPLVQIALKSSLPAEVYLPFFIGQPLEIVIRDFGKMNGAKFDVQLEGGFDTRDKHTWAYSGRGQVDNVTYKGVPIAMAKCQLALSHKELDFFDGTVVFNYDNYGLQNAFGGPTRGTAKVGRVRYDGEKKWVEVEGVEGNIWASPLVRLFAPKIADMLETYRFHSTPALKGNGVVDVTREGRTNLTVDFSSDKPADYKFLGENVTFAHPSGEVLLKGEHVYINDLKLDAFGGPVAARFTSTTGKLEGELSWTQVELADIAETYGFELKGRGTATGRIEFSMNDGNVETMNGHGLLGLERAELFSVPMFGPLSPLVGAALGDKRAGYERAKDAFFTFQIRKGVLSSNDFRTTTSSLILTGDGSINLATRDVDMTMRMNARGFLGLITLPLKPFYGLFQFHGTGPMKHTEWKSQLFTAPPESQNEVLLAPPPKAHAVGAEPMEEPKKRSLRERLLDPGGSRTADDEEEAPKRRFLDRLRPDPPKALPAPEN